MPPKAKRPCRVPMCPGKTSDSHGYCSAHASLAIGWNNPRRGTAEQRGYDWTWRKLAKAVLKRDRYLCRCQDCNGRRLPATEVDHRIPKFEGGTNDPSNLFAINENCHKFKTAAESARSRSGRPPGA
ncbi:HNH endonuclease [Pseudomonas sp. 2hn]|uniref:HNH endonuclease n=1 Tax=Pseudomonas sp. 2hn TaxID=2866626 RepID=UPI001C7D0601|nr:HNH endonuclease [Pseudomonas sp. 2hn]